MVLPALSSSVFLSLPALTLRIFIIQQCKRLSHCTFIFSPSACPCASSRAGGITHITPGLLRGCSTGIERPADNQHGDKRGGPSPPPPIDAVGAAVYARLCNDPVLTMLSRKATNVSMHTSRHPLRAHTLSHRAIDPVPRCLVQSPSSP